MYWSILCYKFVNYVWNIIDCLVVVFKKAVGFITINSKNLISRTETLARKIFVR